jgi:DNA-binding MarR family transcriptional regulator
MRYGRGRLGCRDRAAHAAIAISGALSALAGFALALAGKISWSLRNIAGGSSATYRVNGHPAARDCAAEPPHLLHASSGRRIERTSAMMHDWQTSLRASEYYAARILPPATVEETGWDILLALHSDRHCRISLEKLASMTSVPLGTVERWLGALEERKLITGARNPSTDEVRAVLTELGRGQLDRYFSAAEGLQAGANP